MEKSNVLTGFLFCYALDEKAAGLLQQDTTMLFYVAVAQWPQEMQFSV